MKSLTIILAITTLAFAGLYLKEKNVVSPQAAPSAESGSAKSMKSEIALKDDQDLDTLVSENKADLNEAYGFVEERLDKEHQALINQLAFLSATNALLVRELSGYRQEKAIKEEIKELTNEEKEAAKLNRAERILNAADSVGLQFESLDQIDRSRFAEEQLKNHDQLLEMLAEVESFLGDASMSDDIRREMRGKFYKKIPRLKKLYAKEREMLMQDMLKRDLGYKSSEADFIIKEYKFIESLTSMDGMMKQLHRPPKKKE